MYTIGKDDNRLTFWKNRHQFTDADAPHMGETFLMLFTQPWTALQYAKLSNLEEGLVLYHLRNRESWGFYRDLSLESKVHRAIINPCPIGSTTHEIFFSILQLTEDADYPTAERLVGSSSVCEACYNLDRFLMSENINKNITISTI